LAVGEPKELPAPKTAASQTRPDDEEPRAQSWPRTKRRLQCIGALLESSHSARPMQYDSASTAQTLSRWPPLGPHLASLPAPRMNGFDLGAVGAPLFILGHADSFH